jgi:hypothetical protein
MNLTYFANSSLLAPTAIERDGVLVKNAIVAIEGTHRCNQGKKWEFSRQDIQEFGENTNNEILLGRPIALMDNHSKKSEDKLGSLTGMLECREVTELDLPTPEARGMLGKLAIFSKVAIVKKIDDAKSGIMKALSPGMDMTRKIIFEVSAVPIPSMPGVGFFSYEQIRDSQAKYNDQLAKAIGCLNVFVMAQVQDGQGQDQSTEKQTIANFMAMVADLEQIFMVPDPEMADRQIDGISYDSNPYAKQIINRADRPGNFSMAEAIDEAAEIIADDADEVAESPLRKRLRLLPPPLRGMGGNTSYQQHGG